MASTKRPVPEWRLEAYSKSDLSGKLSEIDIPVPSRGCGRTSLHVEKWCICRLLSTLNNNNRLAFPVKVSKSERPDFVITINGNPSFGVEITEAIQEDLAQTMTLPEAQHPEAVTDRSLFRWDDPKKSLEEKRNIASRTRLSGPPWEGDDPEKEFAQAIRDITFTKTEKLNEGDFQRFGENWLEIYDNVSLADWKKRRTISSRPWNRIGAKVHSVIFLIVFSLSESDILSNSANHHFTCIGFVTCGEVQQKNPIFKYGLISGSNKFFHFPQKHFCRNNLYSSFVKAPVS